MEVKIVFSAYKRMSLKQCKWLTGSGGQKTPRNNKGLGFGSLEIMGPHMSRKKQERLHDRGKKNKVGVSVSQGTGLQKKESKYRYEVSTLEEDYYNPKAQVG